MMRRVYLLFAAALCLVGLISPANANCDERELQTCEVRKAATCGPLALRHWTDVDDKIHCDAAVVYLVPGRVIPHLRQLRCFLLGDGGQVIMSTENYLPNGGPKDGDTIVLAGGRADLLLRGRYESISRQASITFENIGPAGMVLLKCSAFGPA